MKLSELKARGAFLSKHPMKKEITWEHMDEQGEKQIDTFDIFVRRHSFGSMEKVLREDPTDPEHSRNASMIAESILLGEDGKEPISYAEAYSLEPSLALEFVKAINEVNGSGRSGPKA